MATPRRLLTALGVLLLLGWLASPAGAILSIQCPGDLDGGGVPDPNLLKADGTPYNNRPNPDYDPNIKCMHITGGDGFVKMADGTDMYMFSFGNATGYQPLENVVAKFSAKAESPAPTFVLKQGEELYLTMTNVGMVMRPDLFDAHTVHGHGFPNAAPIFDGLPEPSPAASMGSSFTYYYKGAVPGTYFWHCHVEAAEHMQMGMMGNGWILPAQNEYPDGTDLNGFTHHTGYTYAYNDGDGSTYYDVAYPVQITAFDSTFHGKSLAVQALPFAAMFDDYPFINGRGYPDTVKTGELLNQNEFNAQPMDSLITATAGQKVLLRISNVSTTHQYTITTNTGEPLLVVGRGAALLQGADGTNHFMSVNALDVAGGQHFDAILDTTNIAPGTYFLYTTNLANLSNGPQERGGLMTEIVIN